MSGSVSKESKVGNRLLKQLYWVCSPFALMTNPKRVNRWWGAEPELCAQLRTCLEGPFSSLKRLLRKQIPSLPTPPCFAVLEGRWQKIQCVFQRTSQSTRDSLLLLEICSTVASTGHN